MLAPVKLVLHLVNQVGQFSEVRLPLSSKTAPFIQSFHNAPPGTVDVTPLRWLSVIRFLNWL